MSVMLLNTRLLHVVFVFLWSLSLISDDEYCVVCQVLTSEDTNLVEEYNSCVEKLKDFRNVHLQVVARLVLIQKD